MFERLFVNGTCVRANPRQVLASTLIQGGRGLCAVKTRGGNQQKYLFITFLHRFHSQAHFFCYKFKTFVHFNLHFTKGLTVFSQNQCQARNSLIGVWGRVFARQGPRRLKFKHLLLVMPHCPLTTKIHVLVLLALIPLPAVSCVAACWSSVSD